MNRPNCPYQVTKSETYQIGRIKIIKDTILIGGTEHPYTYIQQDPGVCVLATYHGDVVLIEQYRHALDQWMTEFPCGGIDQGETAEDAARRELREESGYVAGEMTHLGRYYTNQGVSCAVCDVFFTRCVGRVEPHREETEFIRVRMVPLAEMENMIETNRFQFLVGMTAWNQAKIHDLL